MAKTPRPILTSAQSAASTFLAALGRKGGK
jgi:hypothetical protein